MEATWLKEKNESMGKLRGEKENSENHKPRKVKIEDGQGGGQFG